MSLNYKYRSLYKYVNVGRIDTWNFESCFDVRMVGIIKNFRPNAFIRLSTSFNKLNIFTATYKLGLKWFWTNWGRASESRKRGNQKSALTLCPFPDQTSKLSLICIFGPDPYSGQSEVFGLLCFSVRREI
jgi:hypothetical protein